eukprot:CAMPEP_0201574640 /NCGR_PEP_ID=MMETSP0190_2-20130828/19268_1 /ASSEMBLY_ACC=CAM_ASM_000263 /TAXON_ID=37353 /ORGANISM="Rosalina sp." /LENGTH=145 /DNA_ID=CAMNT_0048003173 /DNA_START=493 /DNA_END=930 /DNA_ORIENTATION=+
MEGSHIYYAAPQHEQYDTMNYIPSDNKLWISVHGSSPGPEIYPNLMEESKPPDNEDEFGNVTPRNNNNTNKKAGASISSLQSVKEADNPKDETVLEDQNENEDDDDDESELSDLGGDDNKEKEKNLEQDGGDEDEEEEESLSDLD